MHSDKQISKPNGKSRSRAKQQQQPLLRCRHFRECGGCQLLERSYEEQLALKERRVRRLLGEFCEVYAITGMAAPLYYRNKVNATFAERRDHRIVAGIYRKGTHELVSVRHCLLEDERAQRIIEDIRELLPSCGIRPYNEDTHRGLLRHVLIRTAHVTGQVMVVLVFGREDVTAARKLTEQLLVLHPEITTVVLNVNDRHTSMILGEKEQILYGPGFIVDELCCLKFRISPRSFYQVNAVQTEHLYRKAMELAGLGACSTESSHTARGTQTGNNIGAVCDQIEYAMQGGVQSDRVKTENDTDDPERPRLIDAYCGIGTIGLVAERCGAQVLGIELNGKAVADARSNAEANGAEQIRFIHADAGAYMKQMASKKMQADVLIMDPPREGSTLQFIRAAAALGPERIVYISCEPRTLARDLKLLDRNGYKAGGVWPYDMFPMTDKVECVCLLRRSDA